MRTATGTLATFLASRPTSLWSVDLFTITLAGGTVLRYCSGDAAVTTGGHTWLNYGPTLTRSAWSIKNTVDVPEMSIVLGSNGTDYTGGANVKQQIHNGLFDGALIELERAMGATPGTVAGTVLLFSGYASTIVIGALGAKITVKGLDVLLQQYMPKNVYKAGCIHSLFDAGCTLAAAAWTAVNIVGSSSTKTRITQPGNWLIGSVVAPGVNLVGGVLAITSGAAAGQRRTIKGGTSGAFGGYLDVSYPFSILPAGSDTLEATFGCDKSQTRCADFSNSANYRGFDYIPIAETAL